MEAPNSPKLARNAMISQVVKFVVTRYFEKIKLHL